MTFDASQDGHEERNYQTGELICHENERPDGMYIVKDGRVEIFQTVQTDKGPAEVSLGKVGVRGMFGEMGLIDHHTRSASARAVGPTTVIFVSRAAFQKHLDQLPPWVAILIKTFVHRLRAANHRLAETIEAAQEGRLQVSSETPAHDIIMSRGDDDDGSGEQLLNELDK